MKNYEFVLDIIGPSNKGINGEAVSNNGCQRLNAFLL